jgi:hypothetical protein
MFEMFWLNLCMISGVTYHRHQLNHRPLSLERITAIIQALKN